MYKSNEVWYPEKTIIILFSYEIMLASCTNWWNTKCLNIQVYLQCPFL